MPRERYSYNSFHEISKAVDKIEVGTVFGAQDVVNILMEEDLSIDGDTVRQYARQMLCVDTSVSAGNRITFTKPYEIDMVRDCTNCPLRTQACAIYDRLR